MRSLFLIVRRELQERLRTKSFRVFTAVLFVLALGAVVAADKAPDLIGERVFSLGIPSETTDALKIAVGDLSALEDIEIELVPYETLEEAESLLETGTVDAFLAEDSLTFISRNNTTLTAVVSRAIFATGLVQRLDDLGLTAAEQNDVLSPRPVEVVLLRPSATDEDERQFTGFIATLILFMTITVYGNSILTGIVEEKSSRVIEVLLGLVHPHELLAGKTIGILLTALGQVAAAIAGGVAGLLLIGTNSLPSFALDVVLAGLPLLVLGLLLYSLFYAAAGATVSVQSDTQAAAAPISIGLLIPYMFAAIFVPDNPDGLASTVLSIFPLTSPLVMPTRVAIGAPSAIELAACYALLVPAILLAAFIGGRIYSGAILGGAKPSIRNLIALVRRPKPVV